MSSEKKNNEGARDRTPKLYTLEVYLIEGPFIEEVDGFVGAMFVVTESLEADVTYTF